MTKNKNQTGQNYTLFLRELIQASGVNIQDLAKRIGITKTSIHHWFSCDDIRLSKLDAVATALGYDLQICIDRKPYQLGDENPAYFSFEQMRNMKLDRLIFLKRAIKASGMTKVRFAEKIGLSKEAITYWYASDDITLRRLVACADILERDLYIRFVKNQSNPYSTDGTGIHLSIEQTNSWNIVREKEQED